MLCKAHPYPRQATLDLYPFVVDEDNKDLFLQLYPTADDFVHSTEFEGIHTSLGKAMNLINAAEIYIAQYKADSAQKCWNLAKKIYDDHVAASFKGFLCLAQAGILSAILKPQLQLLRQKLDVLLEKKLQPTTLARRCFLALLEHGITAEGKKQLLEHTYANDREEKEIIDKMLTVPLNVTGAPAPSTSSALSPPPPSSSAPHIPAPYYSAPQPPELSEDPAPQLWPQI